MLNRVRELIMHKPAAVAGLRIRRFLGLAAALAATVLAPAAVVAAKGVQDTL